MSQPLELLVSVLLLLGGAFVLVGSIGLARLPDFFMRLHGPTKATTLGIGGIIVGLLVHETAVAGAPRLQELAISLFLFITAPVSAHLLAKAALRQRQQAPAGRADQAASKGGSQRGNTPVGDGSSTPV